MDSSDTKPCAAPADSFCTLDTEALNHRRRDWIAAFTPLLVSARPVPGGFELRLRATRDAHDLVAQFIDLERRCCEPLRYDVSPDAPDGSFGFTVAGPGDTANFLSWLLDLAPRDAKRPNTAPEPPSP